MLPAMLWRMYGDGRDCRQGRPVRPHRRPLCDDDARAGAKAASLLKITDGKVGCVPPGSKGLHLDRAGRSSAVYNFGPATPARGQNLRAPQGAQVLRGEVSGVFDPATEDAVSGSS